MALVIMCRPSFSAAMVVVAAVPVVHMVPEIRVVPIAFVVIESLLFHAESSEQMPQQASLEPKQCCGRRFLPEVILFISARTVPVQCPYSARTVPVDSARISFAM